MSMVLADTGPLVALLDRSDYHHEWALECFKVLKPPLFTCEAVLAETCHLLSSMHNSLLALEELCSQNILLTEFSYGQESVSVWKLLKKYRDTPMDFADACLVRISELQPQSKVWTIDSDFKIYRKNNRQTIKLLTPTLPPRR